MRSLLFASLIIAGTAVVAPVSAQVISQPGGTGYYPGQGWEGYTVSPWSGYYPSGSWSGYIPGSGWTGYAPAAALPGTVAQPTAVAGTVAPPAGTVAPGGYIYPSTVPQPTGRYISQTGRVVREPNIYGWGRGGSYRAFGSGRPIPLNKPWLPGSPGRR